MNMNITTYNIIMVKGHFEVYDLQGNFITSGDTLKECEEELYEMN